VEHIRRFFASRNEAQSEAPDRRQQAKPAAPATVRAAGGASARKAGMRAGSTITHPKYGKGTVVRREGDGEDAKITVNFPGYGLKKLVAKYAGLKTDE
jgi:DNA helicase-2/ATP-dependent DNA helicase PcrA